MTDILFGKNDFSRQLEATAESMATEVDQIPADQFLNTAAAALSDYLAEKYRVDVPALDVQRIEMDQTEGSVRVDHFSYGVDEVPGTIFKFFVPFAGEAPIFESRPSSWLTVSPRGRVVGNDLVFEFGQAPHTQIDVNQLFQTQLGYVQRYLDWLRADAEKHNASLHAKAAGLIAARRDKLLQSRQQAAELGYPMRRRDGASTYVVPSVQRRPQIKRPTASTKPFVPEPTLDLAEYEHILKIAAAVGRMIELDPAAFSKLSEEQLRSHFLAQFNGHYEGQVTGETFNLSGKTDIIIKERDRNVFIAECKIWNGSSALRDAIDQLLRYASWRDTKTAIFLFYGGSGLSGILPKIPEVFSAHPNHVRTMDYQAEAAFRFVLHSAEDVGRELLVTVMVFPVPSKA